LKDYALGEIIKIKGIRKDAERLNDHTYKQDQFIGFQGKLRRGKLDEVIIKKVIKHLSRIYNKGIVLPDGQVKPLILDYEHETNWLAWDTMLEHYGHLGTYKGEFINRVRTKGFNYQGKVKPLNLSYSSADRRQQRIDEQDARRAGDMIYQRGK
ncbi:unnamed protein product, partial [marine sediment metagenome]